MNIISIFDSLVIELILFLLIKDFIVKKDKGLSFKLAVALYKGNSTN